MSWNEKAKENYAAGRELIDKYPNAASNRFYYASYHAMVDEISKRDNEWSESERLDIERRRKEENSDWAHKMARNAYCRIFMLDSRHRQALEALYLLRLKADYKPFDVDTEELRITIKTPELEDFFEVAGFSSKELL